MKKAAILAAGEGSRLKAITPFKPLAAINGTPLLELTLKNLHFQHFAHVNIIFNEDEKDMDLSLLPSLHLQNIDYFFKSTTSSMHSLLEVSQRLELKENEHFFVSMVDSIVDPYDAKNFLDFCNDLKKDESAIMVTQFIDDESPLTLKINDEGYVIYFQCPIDSEVFVTSGVYYFSAEILPLLSLMIQEGHSKLRNFLSELVVQGHKIKIYHSKKTLDIDRPEDIKGAEDFLRRTCIETEG